MPAGFEWGWDNARALIGIVLIYGLCWVLSEKRKLFPWKIVLGATANLPLNDISALRVSGISAASDRTFDDMTPKGGR